MTDRFILIYSIGRTGSSAMAGALHQAGLPMGREGYFTGSHPYFNAKGHFEEHIWWFHSKEIAKKVEIGVEPRKTDVTGLQLVIRDRRDEGHAVWGIKDVFAPWSLPYWQEYLPQDWRLICLHRRWDSHFQSMLRHGNEGKGRTPEECLVDLSQGLAQYYGSFKRLKSVNQMHVNFEQYVADPATSFAHILNFCYDGIAEVTDEQIQAAAEWIEPELKHF